MDACCPTCKPKKKKREKCVYKLVFAQENTEKCIHVFKFCSKITESGKKKIRSIFVKMIVLQLAATSIFYSGKMIIRIHFQVVLLLNQMMYYA